MKQSLQETNTTYPKYALDIYIEHKISQSCFVVRQF